MSLQNFKDMISTEAFGMTTKEALHQGVCIDCKDNIDEIGFPTEADEKDYQITGLCWKCYPEEEEEDNGEGS